MGIMLWATAKTGVGTHVMIAKFRNTALHLNNYFKKAVSQRVFKNRHQPKQNGKAIVSDGAKSRCLGHTNKVSRFSNVKSNIVRGLVSSHVASRKATERKWRAACRMVRLHRPVRSLPMFSLMGITLGLDGLTEEHRTRLLADLKNEFSEFSWKAPALPRPPHGLSDLDLSPDTLDTGCEGAVFKARVKGQVSEEQAKSQDDFDLAVKALFNYGATSNADVMFQEMHREFVPLHMEELPRNSTLARQVGRLPPHPNIVDMPGVFEDDMLVTREGMEKYPAALPHRLNPERHWGRNKTLYLVMRRRSMHLKDFLATKEVSMETRCLLVAQLLEAVHHLQAHGVAHRDLKANNILVDIPADGGPPKLEICDFGCCLAEEDRSLKVPYVARDVNKGGNIWLMAPEIVTAEPGPSSVLDYSRSDLWAAGALAYEILGAHNPFYPGGPGPQLCSATYTEEDLPSLPSGTPEPLTWLLAALLARDPRDRPTPGVAATVAQLVVLGAGRVMEGLQIQGPAMVYLAQRERAMLRWVSGYAQATLAQLTVGGRHRGAWDAATVNRFVFFSRLTYGDLRLALSYF